MNEATSPRLPWWGWACRSWSRDFHGRVWFAAGTPLSRSPLPRTLSQSHPGGNNTHIHVKWPRSWLWICFFVRSTTTKHLITFLRAWLVLRPQPRPSVFITSVSAYSRLEKHWFSQLSPAGHTWRQQHKKGKKSNFSCLSPSFYCSRNEVKNINMNTNLWMTLVLQHAVETLRVEAARMLVCWSAVASWDFWQVGYVHLHLPHRFVGLIQENSHRMSKNTKDLQKRLQLIHFWG